MALVPTRLSPYPGKIKDQSPIIICLHSVPDVYAEELREAERKDERDKVRYSQSIDISPFYSISFLSL